MNCLTDMLDNRPKITSRLDPDISTRQMARVIINGEQGIGHPLAHGRELRPSHHPDHRHGRRAIGSARHRQTIADREPQPLIERLIGIKVEIFRMLHTLSRPLPIDQLNAHHAQEIPADRKDLKRIPFIFILQSPIHILIPRAQFLMREGDILNPRKAL